MVTGLVPGPHGERPRKRDRSIVQQMVWVAEAKSTGMGMRVAGRSSGPVGMGGTSVCDLDRLRGADEVGAQDP